MKNLKFFSNKYDGTWFLRDLQKRRSNASLKIRKILLWLIRPIDRSSNYLVFRQEPIVHIMSIGIIGTIILVLLDVDWLIEVLPFLLAFTLNGFLSFFFKWFPMGWEEMDDTEKQYIRKIYNKEDDKNWTPFKIKIIE